MLVQDISPWSRFGTPRRPSSLCQALARSPFGRQSDAGSARRRRSLSVDVARVRINRYEKGGRECDLRTAQRLADALGLPLPALFTDEDDLAEMIIFYSKISKRQRQLMLAHFKGYFSKESKIQGDHD